MADTTEQRVQEIENSVGALESQLRTQIAHTQSSTRAILVIGIILIGIIFAYMTYLTGMVRKEADPKTLAQTVDGLLQQRLPALMERVEAKIKDPQAARSHVDHAFNELMKLIPKLRQKAEIASDKVIDNLADRLDKKVDEMVSEMLAESETELRDLVKAAVDEEKPEALREKFRISLKESIGAQLADTLARQDAVLDAVETRIDELMKPDDQLTDEQRLEKELIAWVLFFIDDALAGKVKLLPDMTPATPEKSAG